MKSSGVPILKIKREEKGVIRDIKKMVVRIEGLPTCLNGEILNLGDGVRGIVMGFDANNVLALILGDENRLRMGMGVSGISQPFEIPVGANFVGRVVTALGDPCDSKPPVETELHMPVFRGAASITDRAPVDAFFCTGTKVIDTLVPIGKGQRQLIIGDRLTGKTVIGTDAIINQSGENMICIYCSIGKSYSSLEKVVTVLQERGALAYTVVMTALDSAPAGEQYLLPFCAATLGDYFAAKGKDVLVILDDLTKHAWAYRQLSLLLERPPGREAYPGDIFYVQTQLMERAGRFSDKLGGGSMTFLALAETLDGDMTGYIPSNLISMCDGLIYTSAALFNEGIRPAIDFAQSYSIIGGRTQPPILRKLSRTLRTEFVAYTEVLRASRLQTNLSATAQRALRRGEAILTVLQQDQYHPCSIAQLALVLFALNREFLDTIPRPACAEFRDGIHDYATRHNKGLVDEIEHVRDLTSNLERQLGELMRSYFASRAA